ncbi:hypothetical protein BDV41DRAFT_558255 [Aspergillus transmontanensis]|uniref:Uncharacterized protein n=1 Tax=Aspergillus transmontanensis TaxID=1034304 RepID=A0A5N6VEB3_9EURO|nr:hypothetical protein BDV41DRAFT_558255 [Aspergillus transmontanensis]
MQLDFHYPQTIFPSVCSHWFFTGSGEKQRLRRLDFGTQICYDGSLVHQINI